MKGIISAGAIMSKFGTDRSSNDNSLRNLDVIHRELRRIFVQPPLAC